MYHLSFFLRYCWNRPLGRRVSSVMEGGQVVSKRESMGCRFKGELKALVERINSTEVHLCFPQRSRTWPTTRFYYYYFFRIDQVFSTSEIKIYRVPKHRSMRWLRQTNRQGQRGCTQGIPRNGHWMAISDRLPTPPACHRAIANGHSVATDPVGATYCVRDH